MKAILYAGAVLMTGASIYGFIDYKKTSRNKEFTNMYKTEENNTAVKESPPVVETKPNEQKKIIMLKKDKPVVVNKRSGKVIPVAEDEKSNKEEAAKMTITPVEPVTTETANTAIASPKSSSIKKKKTISYKLFSRGSLEKKYVDKELKTKETKKEKQ